MQAGRAHSAVSCALAGALAFAVVVAPTAAQADEASDLQERVEQTSAAYEAATEHLSDVRTQIEDNQATIDNLEEQLPGLREQAARSIKSQYLMQRSSGSLVQLILSSDDFNDVVSALQYLNIISSKNADAVDNLLDAEQDLRQAKEQLEDQEAQAESAQAAAKQAMDEAISAREEAQRKAQEQLEAERAEAEEALRDAEEKDGSTFTTASGNEVKVEVPAKSTEKKSDTPSESDNSSNKKDNSDSSKSDGSNSTTEPDEVTWTERDKFVNTWSARIDNYLAGSPLAGHGTTFAEAAYDYGVDPRWSPAIACIESGKGANCFRSHNAWGWGSSSWGDWDSAIRAHVKGLASGYGYTLTPAAAKKYCPPNWQFWYSSVLAQMNRI